MKHLTMQELSDLGFILVCSYSHDDFVTQLREKGCVRVSTTWQMPSGNFENQELDVYADSFTGFSKKDLKKLDEILNKLK